MKMPAQLETERLILRKPCLDEARAIFEGWAQDPEVTRYLTWHPHRRIDETEDFVRRCISAWEHEMRFPYIIMLKEMRKYIVHPNISDVPRDSYMYAITK